MWAEELGIPCCKSKEVVKVTVAILLTQKW